MEFLYRTSTGYIMIIILFMMRMRWYYKRRMSYKKKKMLQKKGKKILKQKKLQSSICSVACKHSLFTLCSKLIGECSKGMAALSMHQLLASYCVSIFIYRVDRLIWIVLCCIFMYRVDRLIWIFLYVLLKWAGICLDIGDLRFANVLFLCK